MGVPTRAGTKILARVVPDPEKSIVFFGFGDWEVRVVFVKIFLLIAICAVALAAVGWSSHLFFLVTCPIIIAGCLEKDRKRKENKTK